MFQCWDCYPIDMNTMVYEQFAGNDFAHGQLGNEAFVWLTIWPLRYIVFIDKKKIFADATWKHPHKTKIENVININGHVDGTHLSGTEISIFVLPYDIDHIRQNVPRLCHAPNC